MFSIEYFESDCSTEKDVLRFVKIPSLLLKMIVSVLQLSIKIMKLDVLWICE